MSSGLFCFFWSVLKSTAVVDQFDSPTLSSSMIMANLLLLLSLCKLILDAISCERVSMCVEECPTVRDKGGQMYSDERTIYKCVFVYTD